MDDLIFFKCFPFGNPRDYFPHMFGTLEIPQGMMTVSKLASDACLIAV